jgi:hypothetical protein
MTVICLEISRKPLSETVKLLSRAVKPLAKGHLEISTPSIKSGIYCPPSKYIAISNIKKNQLILIYVLLLLQGIVLLGVLINVALFSCLRAMISKLLCCESQAADKCTYH